MNTTNWKTHWKQLSSSKKANELDHFQYCILKALFAKSENKQEIAEALLRKAFTPIKHEAYGRTKYDTLRRVEYWSKWTNQILQVDSKALLTETQFKAYRKLLQDINAINIKANEPDYLFLFVRQDISSEQQAVQASHAAYKAGTVFNHKPDDTNFVLIGVANGEELDEVSDLLSCNDINHVAFIEPDMGDIVTAMATMPLKEHQKRFLKHYSLLKF